MPAFVQTVDEFLGPALQPTAARLRLALLCLLRVVFFHYFPISLPTSLELRGIRDRLLGDVPLRELSQCDGLTCGRERFHRVGQEAAATFEWHVALSDAQPEDEWTGYEGFIHQVCLDNYLSAHPDPTQIEYYLCGPPPMIDAVIKMLEDLGVAEDMIRYDKF